jgi:hypothetical protein
MANTLKFGNGEWYGKKDTILAYNDENSNYKPLPFDFSRASSATVINKDGLIETVGSGEPRIDYKDDSKGALLLEPSRSNFITYSQDFSNAGWNTSSTRSVDFIPTSTIDPQGKTNAYRITSTASDNQVAFLGSIVSGQSYASSIYVRRVSGSGNVILRNVNNGENNFQVSVNDGWKRIETSATSTSTNGRLYINLVTVGDVIEIWGSQLEQGSYATSYIPTQGGVVTRVADVCTNGGNEQVINSTEGVLYAEISALADDLVPEGVSISDGTINNRVVIFKWTTSNYIKVRVASGGTNYFDKTVVISDITAINKIAVKYKENDFSLFVNGVRLETDFSGLTPIGLDRLNINGATVSSAFYGNVKDVRVYNTALTDSELQALTSN